jgi:hypothetical protein
MPFVPSKNGGSASPFGQTFALNIWLLPLFVTSILTLNHLLPTIPAGLFAVPP